MSYHCNGIGPNKPFSRLLLHYKKIEYQNVWLRYSQVESTAKEIGALPTDKKADGTPRYTIPFMKVSRAGEPDVVISDSPKIAAFLERTFPDPIPAILASYSQSIRASTKKCFAKA